MTNKDQAIGGLICTACIAIAVAYTVALFWPALAPLRPWIVAMPVLIAFLAVLAIGAWIGWTMATTSPPNPLEDLELEETTENLGEEEKE